MAASHRPERSRRTAVDAPGYLDVHRRGLTEVVTGRPAEARMPVLCARQLVAERYAW